MLALRSEGRVDASSTRLAATCSRASSTTGGRSRTSGSTSCARSPTTRRADITRLYWLARVTLVTRLEDIPAFDALFATHFARRAADGRASEEGEEQAPQPKQRRAPAGRARRGHRQERERPRARQPPHLRRHAPTTSPSCARRSPSTCRGSARGAARPRAAARSTCAARCAHATRTGEITQLARRGRPHRPRPLLVLIDVSGSLRATGARLPALRLGRAGRDVHVRHAADARSRRSCASATSTPRWRTSPRPSPTPTAAPASAPRCRSSSTRRATPTARAAR